MARIIARELPPHALLARYRESGAYTDCYTTTVAGRVDQARYVEAFYTTPLFKAERLLLAWFAGRQSTDSEVRRLATGEISTFAAWSVEERLSDQILLCDLSGDTRSWLMSAEGTMGRSPATLLFFGSAIVPRRGHGSISAGYRALLGLHRLYSRALMRSAVNALGGET